MTANAEALGERIHNAGAIFLGAYTPEAIGDYVGGSNMYCQPRVRHGFPPVSVRSIS